MDRRFRAAALLSAFFGLFPAQASAQNTYDVYVDSNGANNGCTITLPGGTFAGADTQLRVTATSGAAPQVTGVSYSACSGGTFGAPVPVSGAYPVGLNNGLGGSDVIELGASVQAVFQGASSARFGFAAQNATGSDVLFTVNGGQGGAIGLGVAYSIPLFGVGGLLLLAALVLVAANRARRHRLTLRLLAIGLLLTSGIALAANFIVDGQVGDWTGVPAAANDPLGDATNGSSNIDLRAAFLAVEGGTVFFRIDVADLQNQAPTATPQAVTTNEDTAATITLASTDPENDPRTYAIVTSPTNGTLSAVTQVPPSGATVVYTPNANFNGTDTFTFRATDAQGADSAPATVTITVTPVDDAPVAVNDAATVAEDAAATAVPVLANDTDIDAGPISITAVTQPANGVVVITGGGTGLTYAPNANYCDVAPPGPADTFTYTLNGGSTATVSMTVTCVDDAPVAVNDTATVAEDSGAGAIPVLANDTDIDAGPITINAVTQPANGAVVITGGGSGLTYAPNANYCDVAPPGPADTFTYTLNGGSTATVSVTVTCVDDPPVAVNDAATVVEDSAATAVPVLANDTDVDAGPISIASVTQPANGTVVITGGGTGLTYAPSLNYCDAPPPGPADTFTYTLNGGSTATVSMTVTCVDDAPVAVNDAATVAEDSGATAVPVLANDTDIDAGPLTINSVTQPANGTVVITGGGTGLTYAPAANFCDVPPPGPADTFTYTLNGGSTATVSMTVTCVDDAPVAVNDAATVAEDSAATAVNVLANDTDVDGGTITIASATQPANGTVVVTGGGTGLTYQPAANYCNTPPGTTPDTFTYTLNGGSVATVSMAVTCIDDAPTAVNDAATVAEDSGANAIDVLANDTDIDGGPRSVSAVTQSANGVVVITGGGTGLTYAPNLNYCDVPPPGPADTFTYTLTPGGTSATVSITVTCVDDAPVAVADSATVVQGSGANPINVLANDTDIDGGPISVASVTQPVNGVVVITGGGTGVTYQPNAGYCNNPPGTAPSTFTYTLNGGSTATVSVLVTCDVPPTAVNDAATVIEDAAATAVNVLANDTDPDGGPRSISAVTQPANGVVVITGGGTGLTYQPNANYCNNPPGTTLDTFTYTLTPGGSTATVTMTVTCVDDAPVAVADAATVVEDSGATAVPVLANDTDIDAGPKTVNAVTQPANGVVVITGGGTGLTYQPNPNFNGTDTFTYTLNGGSSATVTMTVTPVNDTPVANPQSVTTNEDTPITITLTGTDVDGATTLTFAIGTPPTLGALGAITQVTATSATVVYTPNANANGPDSFTFTVNDGTATSPGATVSITINPVDDPPVAVADAATVIEDSGANAINVLANDTDIDSGPKTVNTVTQPANGTVVITGGGTGLTYAPAANYCNNPPGTTLETFTYTLNGGSSTTVTVTVTCVNDAPTVTPPAATFAVLGNVRIQVTAASPNGLLSTVADVDGPTPITVQNATYTSAQGGNVTVNQATGAWTYNPPAGYEGADSFTYNVCDAFAPPACSANATVNLNVGGMVWFVQTGATACTLRASGCGRLTNPYSTLAAFQAENNNGAGGLNPGNADNIFLFENATSYVGPVVLLTDQKLVGQDASSSLQSITGVTVPAFSDPLPAMNLGAPATTITSATNAIAISNGAGNDNTIRGLTVGNVSASGTGINMNAGATTFGTLTLGSAAPSDLTIDTNGRALNLQGGTLAARIASLTSNGSTQQAINLDTIAGTLNIDAGAITDPAGTDIAITGGNATITYAGTITDDQGQLINVANTTGGTKTFSGAITDGNDGDGNGISLTSNTGATINFTGGIALSTGANAAFTATGGGTVSATQNNGSIVNTIATTTGVALNVTNTTIGLANLTFRSISAGTAVGSAGVGINLDNTGTSAATAGGLHVVGNGSAQSGGTIRNKTGVDDSITGGIGIFLRDTRDVQLARMQLNDFDNSAIVGRNVNGFALDSSVISGVVGNASGPQEGPIVMGLSNPGGTNGLQGTGTIHDTRISGGVEHNLEFYNQSGSMTLTVDGTNPVNAGSATDPSDDTANCVIEENSVAFGGDGIQMEMQGTAIGTITVNRCLFRDNKSQAIQVAANDSSAATVTIQNSRATRNNGAGGQGNEGMILSNGSNGDLTATVDNNDFFGILGANIFVGQTAGNATSASNLIAKVTNNRMTTGFVGGPYPTNRTLLAFLTSTVGQASVANLLISGNTIDTQSDPVNGIAQPLFVSTPDANTGPAYTARVNNNLVNINDPAGTSPNGIAIQSTQGNGTVNGNGCFAIAGNDVNYTPAAPANGLRLRQAGNGIARLEGAGAAATVLSGNNPLATTEVLGTVTVVPPGTCLPAPP